MDEAKLPKWARDKLESLRREVDRLRTDRDFLVNGSDATKCKGFWLECGIDDGPDYPLPLATRRLNFRGSTGNLSLSQEADRSSGKTWLKINASSGGLIVRPHVSNVIDVRALSHEELY